MTTDRRWVAALLVVALVVLVATLTTASGYTTATIRDEETVTVDVRIENATAMNDDNPGNPGGGNGGVSGQDATGGNETTTGSTNASVVAPPIVERFPDR